MGISGVGTGPPCRKVSAQSPGPEPSRPVAEGGQKLGHDLAGLLVDEASFGVAPLLAMGDHHLRPVEQMHVEKHAALAQMILGPALCPACPGLPP
jgi:hypothetical protein